MQEKELVSIIVPIYKVEKFIEKCIESLILQTYRNIEIILVEDGSPDNSGKICDKYAKEDDRIIVIHQKNKGVSVARNEGMKKANGNWIIFVDGDDFVPIDMVENLYNAAIEESCDICFGNYYIVTKERIKEKKYYDIPQKSKIFTEEDKIILLRKCMENLGVPWGKIYKKDVIERNNIKFKPSLKRMQDSIFNLYVFKEARNIKFINKTVYNYRQFIESSCYKYNPNIEEIAKNILEEIEIFIKRYKLSKQLKNDYDKKSFKLFIEIIKLYYIPKESPLNNKEKIEKIKELSKKMPYKQAIKNIKLRDLNMNYKIAALLAKTHRIVGLYLFYKIIYKNKMKKNYNSEVGKK